MCSEKSFQNLDLKPYNSPIVYKVFLGELLMYIGASAFGLNRISKAHHIIGKMLYHPALKIEFLLCTDAKEAFKIESQLIRELNPILNRYRIIKDGQKVSFREKRRLALEDFKNFRVAK